VVTKLRSQMEQIRIEEFAGPMRDIEKAKQQVVQEELTIVIPSDAHVYLAHCNFLKLNH
jgi:tyrosine-protein phosphatase YwqE